MDFLPIFRFSVYGGWWFSVIFLISNLIMALAFPAFRTKVLVKPDPKGTLEKLTMITGLLLFQGGNILAVFIPIKLDPFWCLIGGGLFLIAFSSYVWAIITFVQTEGQTPVTTGPYRFSRNPQQLAIALMWTGAGFCMGTWFYALLGLVQLILAYPGFKSQERFCLARYGQAYRDYMARVPRYMVFGQNKLPASSH
ncbi:isoprenylcysteine carboxylmethyltransferase family protein [Patescibacteria group bacterium]|nr:isoprenylcysteine carboxylmethyltransferase family protein [Patescibacteria group bacterium]